MGAVATRAAAHLSSLASSSWNSMKAFTHTLNVRGGVETSAVRGRKLLYRARPDLPRLVEGGIDASYQRLKLASRDRVELVDVEVP